MPFKIRLKTGFFETKSCELLIDRENLILHPTESGSAVMTIPSDDIVLITLRNDKNLEMDIQIWGKPCLSILCDKSDFDNLLEVLKENLRSRIICEYDGGRDHA